ncbi:MAG: T9SS type A sorting domain-containing protein [Rudanella sp.]|nr:T9SS type A sorting domain-containing protein [Rudanella sp.]
MTYNLRLTTVIFFLPLLSLAQRYSFRYDQRPSAMVSGKTLPNAFAGGLNSCQFSMVRLNDDTRDDLVVFDRTTSKISTFLAQTDGSFRYDPTYETAFPATYNWLLMVDYDADGKRDVFTAGVAGMRVYRNTSTTGKVSFQLVANPLQVEGFSGRQPLYAGPVDLPAITDLDNDGDLDIIAAEVFGRNPIYYQNLSRDKNPGVSTPGLDFKRNGDCWGNFFINDCQDFTFGVNCQTGGRIATPTSTAGQARPVHSGITLTITDTDGDNRKDILIGHVGCLNATRLRNVATNDEKANFVAADNDFPATNPINFPSFPALFVEDIDGDGKRDLLASTNNGTNDGGLTDFRASNWFYRNAGTTEKPDYQLVQKNFLQDGMIDLGESAAPTLADMDGDGDADMLVGYAGMLTDKGTRASLWYFENKGTVNDPAFDLITTDYLGLAQSVMLTYTQPQLVDMDGDKSPDLVLMGRVGRGVQLRVFYNQAARGSMARFNAGDAKTITLPGDFGAGELPTFVDVDRDGIMDVLVGKQIGSVEYLRNTGTNGNPVFTLQNSAFGGFKPNNLTRARSLAVADLNGDQRPELIVASSDGKLLLYRFPDQPDQPSVLLDSLKSLSYPGTGLLISAADLDGDQLPDLVVGSMAGGLQFLKNTSEKVVITATEPDESSTPWAYPNPTDRFVTVRPPHDGQAELVNLSGQVVRTGVWVRAHNETTLDLSSLDDVTYLIRLLSSDKPARVQKVVLWK